jgi:large subunit ribosomal protein L25
MKQNITTTVPIHFEGDAPGVKVGGVLMHSVQHITIEALPDNLPEALTFDVSQMEIGDTVHVRDLTAPKGVTILDSEDEIVASLVPPVVAEEEEAAAEEQAEPEVIGETPEEE